MSDDDDDDTEESDSDVEQIRFWVNQVVGTTVRAGLPHTLRLTDRSSYHLAQVLLETTNAPIDTLEIGLSRLAQPNGAGVRSLLEYVSSSEVLHTIRLYDAGCLPNRSWIVDAMLQAAIDNPSIRNIMVSEACVEIKSLIELVLANRIQDLHLFDTHCGVEKAPENMGALVSAFATNTSIRRLNLELQFTSFLEPVLMRVASFHALENLSVSLEDALCAAALSHALIHCHKALVTLGITYTRFNQEMTVALVPGLQQNHTVRHFCLWHNHWNSCAPRGSQARFFTIILSKKDCTIDIHPGYGNFDQRQLVQDVRRLYERLQSLPTSYLAPRALFRTLQDPMGISATFQALRDASELFCREKTTLRGPS